MADDAMTEEAPMPPHDALDIAERIVRLETKLDFLIAQMDKLPPSPICIHKHLDFDARMTSMEAWRNRAIGVVMILNIALVVFLDKIKGFFAGP
jgi:hypothetical protein